MENYGSDKPDLRFDNKLLEFKSYIENSNFGTIANGGNSIPFSAFEKWLMGLIPASEVPKFKIPLKNGTNYPTKGSDGLMEAEDNERRHEILLECLEKICVVTEEKVTKKNNKKVYVWL